MRTQLFNVSAACLLALVVTACGGKDLKVEMIDPSSDPKAVADQLRTDLSAARSEHVDILAPQWFMKAERSLRNADQMMGGKELKTRETIMSLAEGRAQIKRAREVAKTTKSVLPNAITAREGARAAGATNFTTEYNEAEARFRTLAEAVENDNVSFARRNAKGVTETFRALELKAIKERTIGQARRVISKAAQMGARKLVPRTYKAAYTHLTSTDQFISKNPYKEKEIRAKADLALFHAHRLVALTKQARRIGKLNAEQNVLWTEKMLTTIAKQAKTEDMRNQSFETQIQNISASLKNLVEDRDYLVAENGDLKAKMGDLRNQVAELQGKTEQERMAKAKLEADKRFNELYQKVREYFTDREAEVYRQGSRLIVRLRSMRFPVGQHVVLPQNYSLLSKVQRAIRTFNAPNVVIEGHTDSTGSKALNDHLSAARAEAVRSYLVANQTLPNEKITAVGYGSNRPLVANSTKEGRATNRRIDVVIAPSVQSMAGTTN